MLYKEDAKKRGGRYFLAVWCLELHASTAGGLGSIPGWGTKIPQALWCGGKNKTKNGFQRVENRCVKFSCAVLSCLVAQSCLSAAATLLCLRGFSWEQHWSQLSQPRGEPRSPAFWVDSLPSEPPEKPYVLMPAYRLSTRPMFLCALLNTLPSDTAWHSRCVQSKFHHLASQNFLFVLGSCVFHSWSPCP